MSSKAELVTELKELVKRGRVPSDTVPVTGQDIVANQLPVFGELLVVLAEDLDKAQRRIDRLTWVIIALTAVLTVFTALLVYDSFFITSSISLD